MDSLFRDVSRLNLISQLHIGQERFSVATHFGDFAHYYFSRFFVNLKSIFKDFAYSELSDFNRRHGGKIATLVKYPALRMEKAIVPIPKGMVNSYRKTLDVLLGVLSVIHAKTIEHDLQTILSAIGTGKVKTIAIDQLDKQEFENQKAVIAKLFGKIGLSHSTLEFALPSVSDIAYVNTTLLSTTGEYYPQVMALNPLLQKIETRFNQFKYSEEDKEALSQALLVMAYRLSLFAVVADHLQGLEHGFVGSMDIVLKHS